MKMDLKGATLDFKYIENWTSLFFNFIVVVSSYNVIISYFQQLQNVNQHIISIIHVFISYLCKTIITTPLTEWSINMI